MKCCQILKHSGGRRRSDNEIFGENVTFLARIEKESRKMAAVHYKDNSGSCISTRK